MNKIDTFWSTTLDKKYAKIHSPKNTCLDSAPFKNLYWLLDKARKRQKEESGKSYSLHVVMEDAETEKAVGGLHILLKD